MLDAAHKIPEIVGRLLFGAMIALLAAAFLWKPLNAIEPTCKGNSTKATENLIQLARRADAQRPEKNSHSSDVPNRNESSSIKAQLSACARERLVARKHFDDAVIGYKSGRLTLSKLLEVCNQWSQAEEAYCTILFYSQLTQEDLVKMPRGRAYTAIATGENGHKVAVSLEEIDEYASRHGLSSQEAVKHMQKELLDEKQNGKSVK